MAFDYENYMKAMESFMLQMKSITDIRSSQFGGALKDICQFLRIGRIEICFCEVLSDGKKKEENIIHHFLDNGACEEKNEFTAKEITGEENTVYYKFYPIAGEPLWSEIEIDKISVLEKMLHSFYSLVRIMGAAEKMKFRDQQLPLWNLSYFTKLVEKQIEMGQIERYAACYFNIKRFSTVNQSIGRDNGTKVMLAFVKNLEDELTQEECVCRVSRDNFIIFFYKEKLDFIVEYLQGMDIFYDEKENKNVNIGATAGYYVVPDKDAVRTPNDLMDKIVSAVNMARNIAKAPYVFYNEAVMEKINNIKQVESDFRRALENEEFLVYYQPKVELKEYKLAGAEALCRWMKNGKIVPPDSFIPILEQGNSICQLDFYVLEHVCKDMRRWMKEGKEMVRISVNLSRRHLEDQDLLDHIFSIVDYYRIPHQYLEMELTETTTDVEFKDLKRIVSGLQSRGIHTSVDDFGVGYSSLNLIEEMSWNVLKVDKSFLPLKENGDTRKSVMFKHIIALAQNLGLECIAEGVENIEQVRILKENNCFLAQGFYFDRPLPAAEFEKRMQRVGEA